MYQASPVDRSEQLTLDVTDLVESGLVSRLYLSTWSESPREVVVSGVTNTKGSLGTTSGLPCENVTTCSAKWLGGNESEEQSWVK
jgi:hypothetical protein